MPYLIHSLGLVACQLAVRINGILLKKVPNLIARCQEVLISDMIVVACRELCLTPTTAGLQGMWLQFLPTRPEINEVTPQR